MKIYDKTLPEIFQDIPLSYKIMMVCCALFIALTIVYVPYVYFTYGSRGPKTPPLTISGHKDGFFGMLDPSVAFDGENHFIAYTAANLPVKDMPDLRTQIYVAHGGKESCNLWAYYSTPFAGKPETLVGPDGVTPVTKGFWRVETPTLVYDPDDKGREWKLYAYKYFWGKDVGLARLYGAIVYRYTADITNHTGWSTEEWVFGASEKSPPFPYSQIVQMQLDKLHPSLKEIYFYTRPSVVYVDKTLVMTLSAFIKGRQTPDRVILIASKDHGKTWHYLGTPLRADQIRAVKTEDGEEHNVLQGATLIMQNGVPYLAAVLGNERVESNGTFIFGFENISAGEIFKKADGTPRVLNHIPLSSFTPTNVGGGFAAYSDSCKDTGVITSEMSGVRRRYGLFSTKKKPIPEE